MLNDPLFWLLVRDSKVKGDAIALASAVAFAASPFEGKWKVKDTKGNPGSLLEARA